MRFAMSALLGLFAAFLVHAEASRYPPVVTEHRLVFPHDTGAHPDFRTEWWYVTGWLTDEQGVERGFQVTFFRVRTLIGEDNPSRFAPSQLILAHAAIADPAHGRLMHAERAERALAPLAGAAVGTTRAWIGDWVLEWVDNHYVSRIDTDTFGFDLRFDTSLAPVPNGRAGFSQKAPDPINASYYYSRPQLAASGTLRIGDTPFAVSGHAWLDHEWSSEILPEGAQGWDWIGINLHDGGSLMAFQMRDSENVPLWTAGTLRHADGAKHILEAAQVQFTPVRSWDSPRSGRRYPVQWMVNINDRQLAIEPLMDDQELDSRTSTGAIYWEGAVRVLEDGVEVGQGYLEMTGYGERLRM